MTAQSAASAAYIVAALLFILALAGLSRHETARVRQHVRHRRAWRSRWSPRWCWRWPAALTGLQLALLIVAVLIGAVIGLIRAARVRDDRHARADRAVPQLRRPRRGAGGLERLPRGRGARGVPKRSRRARPDAAGHPPRRGGHRRVHRRGDLHRLDRRVGQALRAVQVGAAGAARQERAEPRRAGRVRRAHRVVRHRPDARGAGRGHRHRAGARRPPRRLDRRRRHARRRVHAQQLLRLGRGGLGLPARQRPADHHRCARRLVRCVPVLHHVQGDEPLVHLRHRRRLRHRGAVGQDEKDYGEHREVNAEAVAELLAGGLERDHHPRLRHGRRAGPVPGRRAHPAPAGARASTSGSASTPWPAGCPAT